MERNRLVIAVACVHMAPGDSTRFQPHVLDTLRTLAMARRIRSASLETRTDRLKLRAKITAMARAF
jgi:hypothetical protein